MTAIRGENSRDTKALGHGDYGRIHKPERRINVHAHQVGCPRRVRRAQRLNVQLPARNESYHFDLGPWTDATAYEVSQLGKNGDRQYHPVTSRLPPFYDAPMPRVVPVRQSIERAGICKNGQE